MKEEKIGDATINEEMKSLGFLMVTECLSRFNICTGLLNTYS